MKRLRNLRVEEASLVDAPACPGATVEIYKAGGRPMIEEIRARLGDPEQEVTKGDADALLREHLAETDPGESYGAALAKRWKDPDVQALYSVHEEASPDPEPAPIEKSLPGDKIWQAIEKLGRELQAEAGYTISKEEAVEEACRRRPDLYKALDLAVNGLRQD